MFRVGSRLSSLCCGLVLACSLVQTVSATYGALMLDQYNFDMVVDGTRTVLVKFDKPLRGPKDEQFRDLARNVGERGNGARFLVADVNVQDHGDRLNDVLRQRYDLPHETLPTFMLFKKGEPTNKPVHYHGEFSEKALLKFLKAEGIYIGEHGTLEGMNGYAVEFKASAGKPDVRRDILNRARTHAGTYDDPTDKANAEYYVKVMEKVLESSDGYVASELDRLHKLRDSKVSYGKKQEFRSKVNILRLFNIHDTAGEL